MSLTVVLVASVLIVAVNQVAALGPRWVSPIVTLVLAGMALLWSVLVGADMTDLGLWSDRAVLSVLGGLAFVVLAIIGGSIAGRKLHPGRPDPFVPRTGRALAFDLLIRLTMLTALCEELLFRSVLLWVWLDALGQRVDASVVSALPAILAAATAFGLWHIMPTVVRQRATGDPITVLVMAGCIVAPFLFAVVGSLLRLGTGNIFLTWFLHVGLNAGTIVAKYVAQARSSARSVVG